MKKTYVGIDNGVSGALAWSNKDWHRTPLKGPAKRPFIDVLAIRRLMIGVPNPFFVIEAGQKNPEFGAVGNYSQGMSHGRLLALMELTSWPFIFVNPQMWQNEIFAELPEKKYKDTKEKSRTFCELRYGFWPKHDGVADALCLAYFGKRKEF